MAINKMTHKLRKVQQELTEAGMRRREKRIKYFNETGKRVLHSINNLGHKVYVC